MKRLLTLVLAAAAVVALVLWDRHRPSTDQAAHAHEQLAPGFHRQDVSQIVITRGGATTTLARTGGVWTVGGLRADEDAVDALLSEVELGRVGRTVGKADEPLRKTLGLDPPRVVVAMNGLRLPLGGDAPGGVYVQRGEDVRVADKRLFEVANRDEWRSRRLTLTNVAQAKTISIGDTHLARTAAGWTVDGAPADEKAVDALLDTLDSVRATELPSSPAPAGGVPLAIDGRVEARLLDRCAARADGAWLCFDKPLQVDAARLRERRLYPFSADAVTAIDLREGDRVLSLRRQSGIWRITAPLAAAGPADDPSVHAWLQRLVALEADGGPQTLTVRTADAAATHHVHDQPLDPLALRDRRVIDLRPDDITRLEIVEGGRTRAIVREHHGAQADTFHTDPPSNADEDTLARLVETFARLRADRFVREPLGPVTRRLRTNDHEVQLGAHCRARVGDLTFTLQPSDCRALTE